MVLPLLCKYYFNTPSRRKLAFKADSLKGANDLIFLNAILSVFSWGNL